MNNKVEGITVLFYVIFIIACAVGYIGNVVKLVKADFASPYKVEVIRTAGIIIPPVGVVCGYIHIEDGKKQQQTLIEN